jgi:hypothetical protein
MRVGISSLNLTSSGASVLLHDSLVFGADITTITRKHNGII